MRWPTLLLATLLGCCAPVGARAAAHCDGRSVYVLNGLFVYVGEGPMGRIATKLEARGFCVTRMTHVGARWVEKSPTYWIGHSMGGNAALRVAGQLPTKPKLIVTIDPGRAPLSHRCPAGVRCRNIYDPLHPIGGQHVAGAENIRVGGTVHSFMPLSARVERLVLEVVR